VQSLCLYICPASCKGCGITHFLPEFRALRGTSDPGTPFGRAWRFYRFRDEAYGTSKKEAPFNAVFGLVSGPALQVAENSFCTTARLLPPLMPYVLGGSAAEVRFSTGCLMGPFAPKGIPPLNCHPA
jgi:hypothetical protein